MPEAPRRICEPVRGIRPRTPGITGESPILGPPVFRVGLLFQIRLISQATGLPVCLHRASYSAGGGFVGGQRVVVSGSLAAHSVTVRVYSSGWWPCVEWCMPRMVAGVLASLAELELELGRERRAAAREARRARGQHIGRPKALDKSKAELARRCTAAASQSPRLRPRSASVVPPCIAS